jgi:hypothetical protein
MISQRLSTLLVILNGLMINPIIVAQHGSLLYAAVQVEDDILGLCWGAVTATGSVDVDADTFYCWKAIQASAARLIQIKRALVSVA